MKTHKHTRRQSQSSTPRAPLKWNSFESRPRIGKFTIFSARKLGWRSLSKGVRAWLPQKDKLTTPLVDAIFGGCVSKPPLAPLFLHLMAEVLTNNRGEITVESVDMVEVLTQAQSEKIVGEPGPIELVCTWLLVEYARKHSVVPFLFGAAVASISTLSHRSGRSSRCTCLCPFWFWSQRCSRPVPRLL